MKLAQALALAVTLAIVSFASAAQAVEVNGIRFPEQMKVGGKSLSLNGVGLRQATFLKVNVYAGGLYLETPSHDAEKIDGSDGLKSIEMVFMRGVDAKDISKAWGECFEKNCKTGCDAMSAPVSKLQAMMTDMKKGEVMAYDFYPDHVDTRIRGNKVGTIEGKDFSKNLLRCWIGPHPANEGLKSGMLGIKD
jgi:hypothetical protein